MLYFKTIELFKKLVYSVYMKGGEKMEKLILFDKELIDTIHVSRHISMHSFRKHVIFILKKYFRESRENNVLNASEIAFGLEPIKNSPDQINGRG